MLYLFILHKIFLKFCQKIAKNILLSFMLAFMIRFMEEYFKSDNEKNFNHLKFEPEYIFHLAAKPSVQWSVENPSDSLNHNVLGSSRVLEYAKLVGAKRVIFASSAAAQIPSSPYGAHKRMTELECKIYSTLYDIDTVCLRYFNVYSKDQKYGGPYSTVISAWMEMIKQNKPLRIDGDGTQTRDFVHVDDIIGANIFCMSQDRDFNGATCDVGTGTETSLTQLSERSRTDIPSY